MLVEIVKRTPPWVWALLIGLIVLGVMQLRDRQMSRARLLALPVAMLVLSLVLTASAFEAATAALIGWVIGGTVAVAAFRSPPGPTGDRRGEGLYHVAGSWWPLVLILCIFFIRYVGNVMLAIDPGWRQHLPFQAATGLLSGAFAGVFLGRAFGVLGIGRGRGLLKWTVGMAALALVPIAVALVLIAMPARAEESELARPSPELQAFMKSVPQIQLRCDTSRRATAPTGTARFGNRL